VGHKAAPPHGALTLNTTIPPRVSPCEASSLAICERPVLMLLTDDHALGDTTPNSQKSIMLLIITTTIKIKINNNNKRSLSSSQ